MDKRNSWEAPHIEELDINQTQASPTGGTRVDGSIWDGIPGQSNQIGDLYGPELS